MATANEQKLFAAIIALQREHTALKAEIQALKNTQAMLPVMERRLDLLERGIDQLASGHSLAGTVAAIKAASAEKPASKGMAETALGFVGRFVDKKAGTS